MLAALRRNDASVWKSAAPLTFVKAVAPAEAQFSPASPTHMEKVIMSLGPTTKKSGRAFGIGLAMLLGTAAAPAFAEGATLSEEAFERSKQL